MKFDDFSIIQTVNFLNSLSQVLQRIDDVTLMCEKRIVTLKKLATKPTRPVQTVTPEPAVPLQPNTGAPHLLRHRKGSAQRVVSENPKLLISLKHLDMQMKTTILG
jgi:hypothetical protein